MAVRRVSDLPNLDVVYQNSQLSNCLIEVSYTPDPANSPRLYQSFYESGSNFAYKVGNYLTNSNSFITPSDLSALGIGDLTDLINMLNALLNTDDLYLLVAQCGVPYTELNKAGSISYDVVELRDGSSTKIGKTIVWKSDPTAFISNFTTKYYTAQKHDVIFFKTVYDAMKVAQRFKFLEGAGIKIMICTDLVEPLKVNFSVTSSKVRINGVQLISQNLNHSDSCALEISGTKINSMTRVYSQQTKKLEYCTMSFAPKMRTIYRDSYSLYNARYGYFVSSNLITTYSYIIFDTGSLTKYDNVTGSNQCIATSNSDRTQFNCVAFLKYDIAVAGSNITTSNCSFSRCGTCLYIVGGNQTIIANSFESLSCTTVVSDREAGTLIRNPNTDGLIYIKSTVDNANFGTVQSNGIINVRTATNYAPSQYNQFISAEVNSSYSSSDWTDVSYSDMKNYIDNCDPNTTTLGKYAVNPAHNALVVDVGSNRKIYECTYDASRFLNFVKEVTGNTPSRTSTSNERYAGPTASDGYLDFSLDKFQQTVVSYSSLYDDYETTRFNSTSRLRSAFAHGGQLTMGNIWDSGYYRSNYKNDSQLSYDISNNEKFSMNVFNDPDTGGTTHSYLVLNSVTPISPTGYSLINYRQSDMTTNYSFTSIDYNDAFKQLTSTMETQYGYIISQT